MSGFAYEYWNKSEIVELAGELDTIAVLVNRHQSNIDDIELDCLLNLMRKMTGTIAAFLSEELRNAEITNG